MTRHSRSRRVFDMTQPLTEAEAVEFEKAFAAISERALPWRWLQREIAIAEHTIREIERGAPGSDDPDIFKPHAGAGWYSKEILTRAKWIENAKASANWELVARFSFELGQLAVTILLKNAWDDDIEAAVAIQNARDDAVAATRKWGRDDRIAAIQAVLDEGKLGVTTAFKVAAKRHPGKGGWKAFETDWYSKKSP
jgi:hypothetical protein